MSENPGMKQSYLITLSGDFGRWERMPQAERDAFMRKYVAWVGMLQTEGRFISGDPLTPNARRLKSVDGKIAIDGPYPESKEALTGYFVVRAKDMDDAVESAKGCPAFLHGETVEIFEIGGE